MERVAISVISYGQDNCTEMKESTDKVLPTHILPGIEKSIMHEHFNDITRYMNLAAPRAQIAESEVLPL